MSSIFSTQKRHTFLRRKYCFLVAIALSPPVGLWDALMGRPPPLLSAIIVASYSFSTATGAPAIGAQGGDADPPAMACSSDGCAGADTCGAGRRAARFSRAFLRFSLFFIFSSMRTVMHLRTW